MIPNTPQNPKAIPLVMWVIWFAILQGLFVLYYFAAPKPTPDEDALPLSLSVISFIGLASVSVGMIVRWLIIPRISELTAKLPVMIFGIALCEGCGIIGMFATHNTQERTLMFIVAVIGVILSAPLYAKPPRKDDGFHVQP